MAESKTRKFTVVVAPREGGHPGWWSGGKFWAANQQYEDVEMTDEEAAALARRPGVVVLVGGKAVKASEPSGSSTTSVPLTSDEMEAVNLYRAQRSRMAEAHKGAQAGGGTKLEYEGKKEALDRALAPTAATGAPGGVPGITAATPLQDADILRGETPPSATGPEGSPIQQPTSGKKGR